MLHGYGSRKESFFYQAEYLSKYFEVIAPDFPAFGASSPIDEAWGVGDYADWLKSFISALKLEKPHILAHSFGARVAIKLLSEEHNLADRLIITGGAGIVKERSKEYIRRVKAYRRMKKIFPKLAERRYGSEEYRALSPLMRESYKKIVNEDLRGCASRIENKTLLIYGEDDKTTPPEEEGKIFNGLIKDSDFVTMHGGHFCFCEHSEEFNKAIIKFLLFDKG